MGIKIILFCAPQAQAGVREKMKFSEAFAAGPAIVDNAAHLLL